MWKTSGLCRCDLTGQRPCPAPRENDRPLPRMLWGCGRTATPRPPGPQGTLGATAVAAGTWASPLLSVRGPATGHAGKEVTRTGDRLGCGSPSLRHVVVSKGTVSTQGIWPSVMSSHGIMPKAHTSLALDISLRARLSRATFQWPVLLVPQM